MPDPRMLIAWLVLTILVAMVVIVPIALCLAICARRRAIARFDELREEVRVHLRPKAKTHRD
jgi:hypothetical protein